MAGDMRAAIHLNYSLAADRVVHDSQSNAAAVDLNGWHVIDAGRPNAPFLNAALPLPDCSSPDVADAENWFTQRGARPLFRLQRELHADLIDRLSNVGYVIEREEPVLGLPNPEPPAYDGPLEMERVTDRTELDRMLRRVGIPEDTSDFAVEMGRKTASMPEAVEVWGLINEKLVAGAIVVVTPPLAGIYAVFCEPEYRRRGFGTAVTWDAVRAGLEMGAEYACMGSTPMALNMYRGMGFEPVCNYVMMRPAAD